MAWVERNRHSADVVLQQRGQSATGQFQASLGLSYGGMVDFDFFNNLSDTSESRGFIWWQRMPNGVSAIMQLRNSGSFWIDRYNSG